MKNLPILYSLHNCPYAIRARMALYKAGMPVELRSIKLDNKPSSMLQASPKGSVPVLVVSRVGLKDDTMVIEESLELMLWALAQNDPDNLLCPDENVSLTEMVSFITAFEDKFVTALNAFACAKRYHEPNLEQLRQPCEAVLKEFEQRLTRHAFLFAEQESLADIAVLPLLRKYARIDKQWFRQSPYPKVRQWLNQYLQSRMFSKVMEHHELWQPTKFT
ncbi:glutathione S-transferase [Vibrio sp. SCSIO 43137]|uniref:glutathione S-transferase n=1 Tax=Vibrio sp. SCSIO 43137 TaxID=3021011 RepID=UPI0023073A69|nr:glutathione S-transferase [Vibrio sp. SCSIO 43137]WCE32682.1 glutathione S-transferase [Vibrio sp. SCSIO 43137]